MATLVRPIDLAATLAAPIDAAHWKELEAGRVILTDVTNLQVLIGALTKHGDEFSALPRASRESWCATREPPRRAAAGRRPSSARTATRTRGAGLATP